jgi:hypothetical protein
MVIGSDEYDAKCTADTSVAGKVTQTCTFSKFTIDES